MPAQSDLEDGARRVGERLTALGLTLTTAESCTGGWMAQCITAVSGSSAWFDRGFVAYSNEAKEQMLGVARPLMIEHGSVSEPVVLAMAAGALQRSNGSLVIAASGVSGPGGGTVNKPVGMVCFAWRSRHGASFSATERFAGDRAEVRSQTVLAAFRGIDRHLDALRS